MRTSDWSSDVCSSDLDETAKSPDAANEMLAKLAPAAVANARRELAEMQKLADADHAGYKLAAWDWAYYPGKLSKATYDFDESQTKQYFELDNVPTNGLFHEKLEDRREGKKWGK